MEWRFTVKTLNSNSINQTIICCPGWGQRRRCCQPSRPSSSPRSSSHGRTRGNPDVHKIRNTYDSIPMLWQRGTIFFTIFWWDYCHCVVLETVTKWILNWKTTSRRASSTSPRLYSGLLTMCLSCQNYWSDYDKPVTKSPLRFMREGRETCEDCWRSKQRL